MMDATNDIGPSCSVPLDCGSHYPRTLPLITARTLVANQVPNMQAPFSGPRSAGVTLAPNQVCVSQPLNFLSAIRTVPPTLLPAGTAPAASASWGW